HLFDEVGMAGQVDAARAELEGHQVAVLARAAGEEPEHVAAEFRQIAQEPVPRRAGRAIGGGHELACPPKRSLVAPGEEKQVFCLSSVVRCKAGRLLISLSDAATSATDNGQMTTDESGRQLATPIEAQLRSTCLGASSASGVAFREFVLGHLSFVILVIRIGVLAQENAPRYAGRSKRSQISDSKSE